MFCYRIRKYVGSYLAALGRTDAIVFTGGIGENNGVIRGESLKGLEPLGVQLDEGVNSASKGVEAAISAQQSRVGVYVIPTNEELQIACDTFEIAQKACREQPPVP
jgi:acetate kinase